jgi:aminoglycoside phosphotransferase (APT) family kinase protein
MTTTAADLPGLRLEATTAWLAENLGLTGPLEARLVAGGRSNLTYRLTDATGRQVALRRPPASHVLETAHDMRREWTVLNAVSGHGVPVPTPLALCEDESVSGAVFYVMEWVDGIVPADDESAGQLSEGARRHLTDQLADVMAALHTLDPLEIGLSDWQRPGDFLQRQLKRWHRQIHASGSVHLDLADRVHGELVRLAPTAAELRIVHGDFRAGNVLVGPDGTIRAVLDWELATLGHPLADLGWILASWSRPGDGRPPVTGTPSMLAGFGEREDLLQRYATASGRDVSALPVYEAFARWRSACINAGVRARYMAGAMGDDGHDVSGMEDALGRQLEVAAELVAKL